MKKENLKISGRMKLVLKDKNGKVKQVVNKPNTITALLDAQVADQMSDKGVAAIGYMSVGTGNGQTSASTGMATALARVALDSTTQGAGASDNDVVYAATFPAGTGTGAITEAGVMQGNNNTSLMTYDDFAAVNKTADDILEISWTVTMGAS